MSKSSFWTDHIESWQASDQSQRAYCLAQGISLASFGYWRKKLRPRTEPISRGLVPIAVTAAETSNALLEVVLPNRLTLRVPMTAEPSQVTRWARVLGSC
jgi:hypothetical protein